MSQITRCPFCATTFKVVADQLRISDGWVRCGQCKEVFDASEHLQVEEPAHLLPEMPLDDLRAPPVPVVRTPETVHVWGSTRRPAQTAAGPAVVPGPIEAAQEPASPAPQPEQKTDAAAAMPSAPEWDVPIPPVPPFLVAQAPGGESTEASRDASRVSSGGGVCEDAAPLPLSVERGALAEPAPAAPSRGDGVEGYELPSAPLHDAVVPQASDTGVPEGASAALPDSFEVAGASDGLESQAAERTVDPSDAPDALTDRAQPSPAERDQPGHASVEKASSGDDHVDDGAAADSAASPAEPGFVKAARRSAFWRRPAVRGVLVLVGLVLLSALGLQVAVQERDLIASRYPPVRAWLERLCEPLQCTLQAPRRIAAVVIDSSSFLKVRNDASAYQLQMSVKNTSTLTIAMPALELTLTDAQDQAILRRVLLRDDLDAPAELAPGLVWSGSVSLQVTDGASKVAGYRLLAFYP